jgi:phosphodiesterase/alkaline phosphatase D-like protein
MHVHREAGGPQDPPAGFHVLLGGGDQIYCDELWHTSRLLTRWAEASHAEMLKARLGDAQRERLVQTFVDHYVRRFEAPPFSEALARIPVVFTWDDHDIFDGFGSYPDDLQACRLFQDVFRAATLTYDAFQLGGTAPLHGRSSAAKHRLQKLSFSAGGRILDLVLLDLRSERTALQVMSEEQHTDLRDWLAKRCEALGAERQRHVVVVSSAPLLYLRFSDWTESATAGLRPFNDLRIADDMRDQWESAPHQGERSRLAMLLLAHARASCSRVTVLSGDVHVACRGRFVSNDPKHVLPGEPLAFVELLTASGIVHPPPEAWKFACVQALGSDRPIQLSPFVRGELLPLGNQQFLRARNWLALAFDAFAPARPRTRLWAQWRTEKGPVSEQVVVETPV